MSKRIPVPPELEHLLEKREQEDDRRKLKKRTGIDQRTVNLGPLGALESAADVGDVPTEERRGNKERRTGPDRRQKRRRKS